MYLEKLTPAEKHTMFNIIELLITSNNPNNKKIGTNFNELNQEYQFNFEEKSRFGNYDNYSLKWNLTIKDFEFNHSIKEIADEIEKAKLYYFSFMNAKFPTYAKEYKKYHTEKINQKMQKAIMQAKIECFKDKQALQEEMSIFPKNDDELVR